MVTKHKINDITFDNNFMYLNVDGKPFKISLKIASKKLELADDYQRMIYKISPSGYGIHWSLID